MTERYDVDATLPFVNRIEHEEFPLENNATHFYPVDSRLLVIHKVALWQLFKCINRIQQTSERS